MAERGGNAIEPRTMVAAFGVCASAKLNASDAIIFQQPDPTRGEAVITISILCALVIWLFGGYVDSASQPGLRTSRRSLSNPYFPDQ
jgi:hypothetical protein